MRKILERNKNIHTPEEPKIASSTYLENYPTVTRTFAFIDVAGYTLYTSQNGRYAAAEKLHEFRNAVRETVGRYGVRVDKWLGDGVMLVGIKSNPVLAVVRDLNRRFSDEEFNIHVGVARGKAIIFEGNDYVGEVVNIASRLCDLSAPGQILIYNLRNIDLPRDVKVTKSRKKLELNGVGAVKNVRSII